VLGDRDNSESGAGMQDLSGADTDELRLQKLDAYQRLSAVWADALGAGIEPEVLAHVALFTALGDLVSTYGEAAVADFAKRLPTRIAAGEFSIRPPVH
jgi:hypothetical protein